MRLVVVCLALGVALAEYADEPWIEEEDVEEPYDDDEQVVYRRRREVYVEDPYDEYTRVKRCCEEPSRVRRSADYIRKPRQVHQYEVHEFTEESAEPSSPPYEEMLAAASDHFHRVYVSPDVPKSARYLQPDVSAIPVRQPSQAYKSVQPLAYQPVTEAPIPSLSKLTAQPAVPVSFVHALPVASSSNQRVSGSNSHTHVVSSPVLTPAAPEEPSPVSTVPLAQILTLGGDQSAAAAGHHHQHKHGHVQGGGHKNNVKHLAEHGGKTTKGFNQDHYVDKGGKGHKTDEHHRKEYEEAAGKKKKHHDHAGHKGSHEEEAHGHRGAHFDEKKGHKKGHKTKGYHNKYHKDEFHKEHKFYDDYHKSGEHHRYGKFNAKHASNESGKKKAHHVNAGHDFVERGKKGYSNKGHVDADHKGYNGKDGHEEHHEHHSQHGKKGGKEGGSQWGHAKKN